MERQRHCQGNDDAGDSEFHFSLSLAWRTAGASRCGKPSRQRAETQQLCPGSHGRCDQKICLPDQKIMGIVAELL
jgi:hypothetical protein